MAAWVGTKRPDSLASWRLPYARVVNDEPRANRNARNYFLIRPTGPNPTLITRRRVLRPSPPGFRSCMKWIVTQGERCVFPLRTQVAGRFRSLKNSKLSAPWRIIGENSRYNPVCYEMDSYKYVYVQ